MGPATACRLHDRGIVTVGQLSALPEATLISFLGRASGRHLHHLAHNRDPRRVRVGRRRRSIGSQSALGRATSSHDALDLVVVALVDRVTRRMRASGRRPHRDAPAALRRFLPRYALTHPSPGNRRDPDCPGRGEEAVGDRDANDRPSGLTLVGITVANLDDRGAGVQLALPLDGRWTAGRRDR